MENIFTYDFKENFIENLADFLLEHFAKANGDFSRVACVFGGRRPALFLQRTLARKMHKSFYPPPTFSIDEFVEHIVSEEKPVVKVGDLDASFLIYTLAKELAPDIVRGIDSFSEFLPWAQEIVAFIEQLDLEDIENQALRHIQMSAAIGYEVPQNINVLLQHIVKIRDAYHAILDERKIFSRGLLYREASHRVQKETFDEFDAIIFCNFFYLHATEARLMSQIHTKGKGIYIFQGDQEKWSVLKKNAEMLSTHLKSSRVCTDDPTVSFYAGFDTHSQVSIVREIVKKIEDVNNTVIVLPRPETAIPLLSELSSHAGDFNLSLGYPLKRSSLYALCNALFGAQRSKQVDRYYAKDYLNVLRHPLVKNIRFFSSHHATRVLVHKIEDILTGKEETELGGTLFVELDAIEDAQDLYQLAHDTLMTMDVRVSIDELRQIVKELHRVFFRSWEEVEDFFGFAEVLNVFIVTLLHKSMVMSFPFNVKVIEKLCSIKEEFEVVDFCREPFKLQELSSIFMQKLEGEVVSFVGSPLKGLQVLGLFETRSLNFENVIVMDANEGVLPKLKIYEPLIPREVMLNLGLNRLEKEEEIQRYQFMRLIDAAKNVYLVYAENQEKEKSRFIEELLWARQRQLNRLDVATAPKVSFNLKIIQRKTLIEKNAEIIDFLKNETYSASRLNTYLSCPLQFCYRYVLGLSEAEDLLDEPESPQIGIFIHQLLQETFKTFLGRKPIIDKRFRKNFWRIFQDQFALHIARRMKSDSLLLKGIIENRLQRFLDAEAQRSVEKIVCLEKKFAGYIKVDGASFAFTSQVDRVDQLSPDSYEILDYKTGGMNFIPKRFSQLAKVELNRTSVRDTIRSFQLPLYYYVVKKTLSCAELNASLYSIRTLERKPFIAEDDYPHKDQIMDICLKSLECILKEVVDPHIPFEPDKDEKRCSSCAFKSVCS
ncbi:MAG: PD-(D/E)XK nuclease family protein [Candidatus Omnitrophota bacterium]|nr:MAG: PD-(D/E)XK nuclease family protein [Candidatus Omnitrophota bacterium]